MIDCARDLFKFLKRTAMVSAALHWEFIRQRFAYSCSEAGIPTLTSACLSQHHLA
jgi:hypothetical protein